MFHKITFNRYMDIYSKTAYLIRLQNEEVHGDISDSTLLSFGKISGFHTFISHDTPKNLQNPDNPV